MAATCSWMMAAMPCCRIHKGKEFEEEYAEDGSRFDLAHADNAAFKRTLQLLRLHASG